jgi:hypothetical protein
MIISWCVLPEVRSSDRNASYLEVLSMPHVA